MPTTTVPFPVAYPLAWAHDVSLPVEKRVDNVVFASYQAMRLTGLLLLSDYLETDAVCPALGPYIRGLRMPHWGEWSNLCSQLCKFWEGKLEPKPDRETNFPGLIVGWREVARTGRLPSDSPWGPLLAGLPGLQGPAVSANDAVWKFRNLRAHRKGTATHDSSRDAAELERLLPLVDAQVQALFTDIDFELVRKVDERDEHSAVIRLAGPHVDRKFDPEWWGPEWQGAFERSAIVASMNGLTLPVFPFFVPFDAEGAEQFLAGGGLVEPVGLVDGVTERYVVISGVQESAESTSLVGPVLEALTRKQVDLGLDRDETTARNLAAWTRLNAEMTLNMLRGCKYFPDCYVERQEVEDRLAEQLEKPGRAVLILGEAGAGKSSLVARYVEQQLAGEGHSAHPGKVKKKESLTDYLAWRGSEDLVLYLSGRAAFHGDARLNGRELLCEAVMRCAGVRAGTFTELADFFARLATSIGKDEVPGRRFLLVLDAINEADRFHDMVAAIDEVLPCLEKFPWLRLVVTMRAGAYHEARRLQVERARFGQGLFVNEPYLAVFQNADEAIPQPFLPLRPFRLDTEVPRAYYLRQQALPDRACHVDFRALPLRVRNLLRSPLQLHLFHETFKGNQRCALDLDEWSLAEAYLDRLQQDLPILAPILDAIGRTMFERRKPELPVELAESWMAEWRARNRYDHVAMVSKLDPVEELVASTILVRPVERGIGAERRLHAFHFNCQRICEVVLRRELQRQAGGERPTVAQVHAWIAHVHGDDAGTVFPELASALELLAAKLARSGSSEVLTSLFAPELRQYLAPPRMLEAAVFTLLPSLDEALKAGRPIPDVLSAIFEAGFNDPGMNFAFSVGLQNLQYIAQTLAYRDAALYILQHRMRIIEALGATIENTPEVPDARIRMQVLELLDRARLLRATDRREEAIASYLACIDVVQHHAASNPGEQAVSQLMVAECLIGCGALAPDAATASGYYDRAIVLLKGLRESEDYRESATSMLVNGYSRYADRVYAAQDVTGAFALYSAALEVARQFVTDHPEKLDPRLMLASVLHRLGSVPDIFGDQCRPYLEEAIALRQAGLDRQPEDLELRYDYAEALVALGNLLGQAGQEEGIGDLFSRAEDEMAFVFERDPEHDKVRFTLAYLRGMAAAIANAEGDSATAIRKFGTCLATGISSEMSRYDHPKHLVMRAGMLNRLGEIYKAQRELVPAEWCFREAWRECQVLEARGMLEHSLEFVGVTHHNLGELIAATPSRMAEHMERAACAFWMAMQNEPQNIDLVQQLVESYRWLLLPGPRHPSATARKELVRMLGDQVRWVMSHNPGQELLAQNLTGFLVGVGEELSEWGQGELVDALMTTAQAVCRDFLAVGLCGAAPALGKALSHPGFQEMEAGRFDKARERFDEYVLTFESLSATYPDDVAIGAELVRACIHQGGAIAQQGDVHEAQRSYDRALELARQLQARAPGHPDVLNVLMEAMMAGATFNPSEGKAMDFMASLGRLAMSVEPSELADLDFFTGD